MYQFRLRFHCYSFEGLQLTITALVQIMAWGRPGDKPLSEPMMVIWLAHIWVTRPQWVKRHTGNIIAIRIEHIDWLAKHSYNAVANTLELPQSYSKLSIYFCPYQMPDSVIRVLSEEWHYFTIFMRLTYFRKSRIFCVSYEQCTVVKFRWAMGIVSRIAMLQLRLLQIYLLWVLDVIRFS